MGIFVVLEIIIRVFHLAPLHIVNQSLYEDVLGDYKPNQELVDDLIPGVPYRVTINSQGLRGRDITVQKAPDTYRVLCLGDSSTFGWGVDDEDTYPAQLETLLNQQCAAPTFEVLNAGATAYTSRDYLDYLEKKGDLSDPNLVVVGFYPNDIADLAKPTSGREQRSLYGRRYEPWKSLINSWAFFNFFRNQFAKIFTQFTGRRGNYPQIQQQANDTADTNAQIEALWERYVQDIRAIQVWTQARQINMILIAFPGQAQVTGTDSSTENQERLQSFAQEQHIPFIDLLPYFQQNDSGEPLFIKPGDSHPSARGCEIIAHTLAQQMIRDNSICHP